MLNGHESSCKLKIRVDSDELLSSTKKEYDIHISQLQSTITALEGTISDLKNDNTKLQQRVVDLEINTFKLEAAHETAQKNIYLDMFTREQEKAYTQSVRLIEKSGTSVTNNSNNSKTINMGTLNLSRERLEPLCSTFTREHYDRGGAGSADWVVDNVLTHDDGRLLYRCTDKNRNQFVYRDESGVLVNDVNATRLKEVILPLMRDKIREYKNLKCMEMAEVSDDDSAILDDYNTTHSQHTNLGTEFTRRLVQKTYL